MSLWSSVSSVVDPLDIAGVRSGEREDDYYSKLDKSQSDYQNAVSEGMSEGKKKSSEIYGADTMANLGSNISDVVSKRKALANGEDPSISLLRNQAGQQENKAQAKMSQSGLKGAFAQGAVNEMSTSNQQNIAAQKYKTDQANLSAYQSLLGNIASASTATELGYGQLRGAGIQTPTSPQNKGLLGGIIS